MDLKADTPCLGRLPNALIISDILLFREGLRAGLMRLGSLNVVDATTAKQSRAILESTRIDVVILDASRPSAASHAARVKTEWPELKLVAFGICNDRDMVAGAESGICAFVDEDGEIEDINRAALMALNDESFCSPKTTARLIDHIASLSRQFTSPAYPRLTDREHQVASMVGRGLSNKQIALELHISPATVKNHVHNILEKSKLPSRSAIGGRLEQMQSAELARLPTKSAGCCKPRVADALAM